MSKQMIDKAQGELLPCPFCGGDAEIYEITQGAYVGFYQPRCLDAECLERNSLYGNFEAAFQNWNTRTEQTAELRAEVERLNVGLVAAVDVLALVEDVYCGGRDVPNLEAQVDELKRRLIRMTRQSEEGETIIFDSTDGGGE